MQSELLVVVGFWVLDFALRITEPRLFLSQRDFAGDFIISYLVQMYSNDGIVLKLLTNNFSTCSCV